MTDGPDAVASAAPTTDPRAPYRMWAATAPFRKNGTPVLGTMGSRTERVVVMTVETFQRLVRENPNLSDQATRFELGDLDG